jgi:hypothetical protein
MNFLRILDLNLSTYSCSSSIVQPLMLLLENDQINSDGNLIPKVNKILKTIKDYLGNHSKNI